MPDLLISVFSGLFAAALFGFIVHVQRRALDTVDPFSGAFLSVAGMAASLWLLAPFLISLDWFATHSALIFAAAGLFLPALGQCFQIGSIRFVGPALTSAFGAFTPAFAVVLAMGLLGELPGLQSMVGLSLMIAVLVVASMNTKRTKRSWPLWALLLPLAASLARGLTQPTIKLGLADLPSPFFSTLVMSTVSLVTLGLFVLFTGRSGNVVNAGHGGLRFAFSGVLNGLGIMAISLGLKHGPVAVVSSLLSTAPLWALLFGVVIFRSERLTQRHLWISVLVACAVILIVTS